MNRVGSPTRCVAAGVAIILVLSVLLSLADPAHAQTPDTTPPTLVSAVTNEAGTRIIITFSEDVTTNPLVNFVYEYVNDPNEIYELSYFVRAVLDVTIDGHRDLLDEDSELSGKKLELVLESPAIAMGQQVRISYNNVFAVSAGGLFVDLSGNALATFGDMMVVNRSTITPAVTFPPGPVWDIPGQTAEGWQSLTLDEGSSGTFTVKLASEPSQEETVYMYMWPPRLGTLVGPNGPPPEDTISNPDALLTFDAGTWDTPQTLMVTIDEDEDALDAWGIVYGYVGPPQPIPLRIITSAHLLMKDDDPPLLIALASAPTTPLPTHTALYDENDATAVASLSPIGHTSASWSLYGPDKARFSIRHDPGANTGVLSFRSPPDFEQPSDADGDNVYFVTIFAKNGSSTGLLFATVVVANVELPEFPSATTTRSVAENTAAVMDIGAPVTATTVGAAVTYTLGGTDAASFDIVEATGQLRTMAALDYETRSSYEVTVTATNSEGSVDITVTIDVTNVIELQPLTGPATVDYEENRAVRVAAYSASSEADRELLTWSLSGADAGSFRIDEPGGVLRFDLPIVSPNLFSPQPDYEAPTGADGTYEVTVEVGDGVTSHSLDVEVTITDQDEAGTLTLSTTRPRQGEIVTATLADPDGVTGTATYEWERSAGRNAWVTIAGETSASYTPGAADTNAFLRVTATYSDVHSSGKTTAAMSSEVVAGPLLRSLTVTTNDSTGGVAWRQFKPTFEPRTLHYAVGCDTADTMNLTLAAADDTSRLAVDGVQLTNPGAGITTAAMQAVTQESEVRITVTSADGGATIYVVHCIPDGLHEVTTIKRVATGVTENLIMFPRRQTSSTYLVIIDNNGVPRFLRYHYFYRAGAYFRWFKASETSEWRYAFGTYGEPDGEIIVLDQNFQEVTRVETVSPLQSTNRHDYRILDDGNYLLMSYEPAVRDLSFLTFGTFGTAEDVSDSAIQVRTPGGADLFTWYSYDGMALEDCRPDRTDYAHINSLQMLDDGDIIASFRSCNRILRIDPNLQDAHKVVWRLGPTSLTDEQWQAKNLGPPPLKLIGDPEVEFNGQHAAWLQPNGHLFMFDNGENRRANSWTGEESRTGAEFGRGVEYAIDADNGEAIFLRDHSLNGARKFRAGPGGHIELLDDGDWLISWGSGSRGATVDNRLDGEVMTQVDPETGEEKFSISVIEDSPEGRNWGKQAGGRARRFAQPGGAGGRTHRPGG